MNLVQALMFLCPGAKYKFEGTVIDNNWLYEHLVWEDLFYPKPSFTDLELAYSYSQYSITAGVDYRIERQPYYPSPAEQLDYIYKHGIDAWKLQIDNIKNTYPKPII